MTLHIIFELLSYVVGAFLSVKVFRAKEHLISNENLRYAYYTIVIVGAVLGAVVIGTLNTYYSLEEKEIIGKSILGAIVGATIAVETFKKFTGIQGSTGAYFVPSLVLGIVIGRIGCFLGGLEDYTYGIETNFFLGYDFGDGLLRHPVQLYESATMFLFFFYVLWVYFKDRIYFENKIFYQFILIYSLQRFIWEFLKPYETLAFGMNIFSFICLGLMLYAIIYLRKKQ